MTQGTAVVAVIVEPQFAVVTCVACGEWLGELLGYPSAAGRFRCKKCHKNYCVKLERGHVSIVHRATQECLTCRSSARCDRIRG